MYEILRLASDHGIPEIEDAAEYPLSEFYEDGSEDIKADCPAGYCGAFFLSFL
jgi:hypothetical protein